jgi:uncharacterized protein (DUF1501 family)
VAHIHLSSRRRFIRGLGASFASASLASLLPQLALMPRAMAQSAGGYRALVCVYLAGANDSYNWLVPRDSEAAGSRYDVYRASRGGVYSSSNSSGLALAFSDLLPITPANESSAYGLHPSSSDFSATSGSNTQAHSGLQSLFNQGKAAFVCNTGPLLQPISKNEYDAGAPRPAQLFSHNDQEQLWHVGMGTTGSDVARFGWGGRVAKLTAQTLANGLSPSISVAGASRFLLGDQLIPYQLSSGGTDLIDNYDAASVGNNYASARRAALDELLSGGQSHVFARGYAEIGQRSLAVGESLTALLDAADGSGNVSAVFPSGNSLADQLKMVARMIKVSRNSLGAQRQVYYVRMGSFDLHSGMFDTGPVASTGHGALLTTLNQALGAFWTALGEIDARSQVTTFTMSDFGRTLTGNGNGSDHGWGGNLLLLGDAVAGNKLYGRYPQLKVDANDNANQDWSLGRGQYIPTTAIDQVAATLARWMGVTDSAAIDAMFPLLSRFGASDLGFMA